VKENHVYIIEPGQEAEYGMKPGTLTAPTKMKYVRRDGQAGWAPVK
jgi:hypothetical protein